MASGYVNYDLITAAARDAMRPRLIATMALTLTGAVMLAGLFNAGGHHALPVQLLGVILNLCWLLFGLTALAHQIHTIMCGDSPPTTRMALRFARRRLRSIVMLPLWALALLLLAVAAELFLLWLANLPGIGLVWLAALAIPLLLLNTLLLLAIVLGLFNLAARVAISGDNADQVRRKLWALARQRWSELLIYNVGGLLVTLIAAALILAPLWAGWRLTLRLMETAATTPWHLLLHPSGFWSGMAYMLGLILCGLLVAAVASIPAIVITHVTVAIHRALDRLQEAPHA
ncbi:MAG: hypothetical protein D6678_02415 [Zetaproteobacteria bacterium]|nr:MAG: hypothetical protein D6678_02415 [Zetaproteobacteria bacterium]